MSSPRSENVEHILDLFDEAWNGPTPPIIEDYLVGVGPDSPSYVPMLSELVKIDLERRFKRGEQPALEEYRQRFPACAGDLAGWLDEARAVAQRAAMSQETNHPGTPPTLDVPPFPATLTPPVRILGEYELLERLGGGGMGEVYKVRHRRLNKLVALKLLPAGSQSSRETAARFQREMQAVGALDHPNVVEAHDAGEQASEVYLAMKLIDGVDLDRLVKQRGLLPIAEACELVRQAALGLHYLHVKGLVHRDIKPSNLMRTPDGIVKVLDLGLARWCIEREAGHGLTGMGRWMGTPDYLAPEQIVNATDADARADLYGLGGTLFYLLTGKAPFAHHTSQYSKLEAHRHESPPDLRTLRPDVPPELAALVQRLLAKEPEQRFTTAAEVAVALAAFVPGAQREQAPAAVQEARAPHVPADGATNRRRALQRMIRLPMGQSSRRLTWTLGLIVAVLVGLFAYWWFTRKAPDDEIIIAGKPLEKFVLVAANQKIQPGDAFVELYQLSSDDLDTLAQLLVKKRPKSVLTENEQWLCAVAASLLVLNGRPIEDLSRWTGDAYLEKVSERIAGEATSMKRPLELKLESMVLLLVADMAYARRDWGAAIKGYERYLRIPELDTALKTAIGENTLATAIRKAGNAYLQRADEWVAKGKIREATNDRSAAFKLYGRFDNIEIAGTDLDILPDENKKPKEWTEKEKKGKAQCEARRDGTLWLHNENSSFMYYRLINVDKPSEICFRWRWRLDDSPPGFRNQNDISGLHPLAVIVAFLEGQKLIALHYVWDPLEPKEKFWVVQQSDDKFKFGPNEYETEYPTIVVASKDDPWGSWKTYTRDLAADYRKIYKRDPPPIRAVAIQTECHEGSPDQKRVVEGSVAGLQFIKKVNGRCPDPPPP